MNEVLEIVFACFLFLVAVLAAIAIKAYPKYKVEPTLSKRGLVTSEAKQRLAVLFNQQAQMN